MVERTTGTLSSPPPLNRRHVTRVSPQTRELTATRLVLVAAGYWLDVSGIDGGAALELCLV